MWKRMVWRKDEREKGKEVKENSRESKMGIKDR